MNTQIRMRRAAAALAMGAVLVATAGCVRVELPEDEYQSASEQIEVGEATELEASIDMAAGKLTVTGGAAGAVDADFDFGRPTWRPLVEYDPVDGTGRLSIRTPQVATFGPKGNLRYEWRIALSDELPLNLDVDMGAGEVDLDLRGTRLRDIRVDLGAGDSMIDLSGGWADDVTGEINTGAGTLTLKVPADVGVRIVGYQDGLGTYRADGFAQDGDALVNRAYETAEVRFDLVLRRGIGDVTIETVE